jgi:hypothetical protein
LIPCANELLFFSTLPRVFFPCNHALPHIPSLTTLQQALHSVTSVLFGPIILDYLVRQFTVARIQPCYMAGHDDT